jgi:hypothetical protein
VVLLRLSPRRPLTFRIAAAAVKGLFLGFFDYHVTFSASRALHANLFQKWFGGFAVRIIIAG